MIAGNPITRKLVSCASTAPRFERLSRPWRSSRLIRLGWRPKRPVGTSSRPLRPRSVSRCLRRLALFTYVSSRSPGAWPASVCFANPAETGGDFGAKKEYERGVVKPQQQGGKRCGSAKCAWLCGVRQIQAHRPPTHIEKYGGQHSSHGHRSPRQATCGHIAVDQGK